MKKPSVCISPIDWVMEQATRCITIIKSLQVSFIAFSILAIINELKQVTL